MKLIFSIDNEIIGKFCRECGYWKSMEELRKSKKSTGGRDRLCKKCENKRTKKWKENNSGHVIEYNKKWKKENPDRVKGYIKEWTRKNPEKVKASRKKYRKENSEKIKISDKVYYQNNSEKIKRASKKWKKENPEKVKKIERRRRERNVEYERERKREYYQKNKEKMSIWQKHYRKENSEQYSKYRRNRTARKKNASGDGVMLSELIQTHGSSCYLCNKNSATDIEHLIPLSRGGTNHVDNLRPACRSCNSKKGTKTLEEYLKSEGVK